MKKITLLFILIFALAKTYSQNYQITFAGTGESTTVDSVKVENLTQCKDTSLKGSDTLHIIGTEGINEKSQNLNNSLHIYPSPMTDNCIIEFEATAQGNAAIELYNIAGKRIIQEQAMLPKGIHTYQLNGINSGVYFIKITSETYSYSAKIVSTNTQTETVEISYKGRTANNGNHGYTASTEKTRSERALIKMQYTTGDRLKFTGYSGGIYRTINMLVPANSQTVTFNFVDCTDGDGNHYAVVKIGTQVWMAENLKTTKYNNGTAIPLVTDNTAWSNLTNPGYCWYNNDQATSGIIYGALYNWYTVNTGNLAPTGWHVPTDDEWTTLTTYLGGGSIAGGKLKETCSALWYSPNTGATNETGFTALPGGYRYNHGFYTIGNLGYWWSATESYTSDAWYRYMSCYYSDVYRYLDSKQNGFSVRCVRD